MYIYIYIPTTVTIGWLAEESDESEEVTEDDAAEEEELNGEEEEVEVRVITGGRGGSRLKRLGAAVRSRDTASHRGSKHVTT